MRFQRVTQAVGLVLYTALLFLAAYPFHEGLGVDLFLRLDPLVGVGTMVASREFLSYLIPGLVVLASALLFGRVFCGHICPMGTTLDVMQSPLIGRKKPSAKRASFEATAKYRSYKYLALVGIIAAGAAGVSLVFVGSPLSLITRFYGLCLYPILLLLGDASLDVGAGPLSYLGFQSLTYVQPSLKVFATNIFVGLLIAGITGLSLVHSRFWCRNLCPAGALMGLFSWRPLVRRQVADSCTKCGQCIRECPTGAISKEPSKTVHAECIVCLHCSKICPESSISFSWSGNRVPPPNPKTDLTRRGLVAALGAGLVTAGLFRTSPAQPVPLNRERPIVDPFLIRPPGALPEQQFVTRCVKCGECMKACPTNTLQPVWLQAGWQGLFTPIMLPRLAACAVNCNVCGKVCPTGAIRDLPLVEKNHAKVGTAYIIRRNCLVWEQDKKCLVCDEVCPYNAVSFRPVPDLKHAAPFVTENQCLGCGWCEERCPVEGAAAIRVNIIDEVRLASESYVQKAQEYGLRFKAKDARDVLAPGTFDPVMPSGQKDAYPGASTPSGGSLPPGFIVK